jgi:hypothetical protein
MAEYVPQESVIVGNRADGQNRYHFLGRARPEVTRGLLRRMARMRTG